MINKKIMGLLCITFLFSGCVTANLSIDTDTQGRYGFGGTIDGKNIPTTSGQTLTCTNFSDKGLFCQQTEPGVLTLNQRADGVSQSEIVVERGLLTTTYTMDLSSIVRHTGQRNDSHKEMNAATAKSMGFNLTMSVTMPGKIIEDSSYTISDNHAVVDLTAIIFDHRPVLIKSSEYNGVTIFAILMALIALGSGFLWYKKASSLYPKPFEEVIVCDRFTMTTLLTLSASIVALTLSIMRVERIGDLTQPSPVTIGIPASEINTTEPLAPPMSLERNVTATKIETNLTTNVTKGGTQDAPSLEGNSSTNQ